MSDPELARRVNWILCDAAATVGISCGSGCYDFEGFAEAIVLAAQRGDKLSAPYYRAVHTIWTIFRRNSRKKRDG